MTIQRNKIKNGRGVYDPLILRNLNLPLCRHLDKISDRLMRVVSLSDLRIAIFFFCAQIAASATTFVGTCWCIIVPFYAWFIAVNDAVPIVFWYFGCIWFISVSKWVDVIIESRFKGCFAGFYIVDDFTFVRFLFPKSSRVGNISWSLWQLLCGCIVCWLFYWSVSSSWRGWGFLLRHCFCIDDWFYVISPTYCTFWRVVAIAWFFFVATFSSEIRLLWLDIILFMFGIQL